MFELYNHNLGWRVKPSKLDKIAELEKKHRELEDEIEKLRRE
jgi:hypothetical protein